MNWNQLLSNYVDRQTEGKKNTSWSPWPTKKTKTSSFSVVLITGPATLAESPFKTERNEAAVTFSPR